MKGNMKRITGLLITLLLVVMSFVGCGTIGGGSSDTLRIQIFQGGYGTEWLNEMKALYNEKYPDQKVSIQVIYQSGDAISELKSGSSTVDIFFNKTDISKFVLRPTNIFGTTYETLLEDLTDLYNEKLPGEDVTMKEKMDKFFVDYNEYTDGEGNAKYYATPWAIGMVGIVKNNKIWRDSWELPRTTDELIALLQQIKTETKTAPIIFSLEDSYWNMMYNIWFYQYDGVEGYNNFFNGIAPDGQKYVPEMLLYQGRIESMKVMEEILNPDNGFVHEYSYTSDFTSAQNYFLEGTLGAPLTCNADWMNGELLVNYSPDEIDLEMIKTPIVSSIVEKLSFYRHGSQEFTSLDDATRAQYDKVLQAIIDYVDKKTDQKPTSVEGYAVTDEDIAKITEARGIYMSGSASHQAWIPIYAKNKDAAKKFLQLMATDEGIETFVRGSKGYILPYKYDYGTLQDTMSSYLQNVNGQITSVLQSDDDDLIYCASNMEKDPIFALGGLSASGNNNIGNFVKLMSAKNEKDRRGGEELIFADYEGVAARWSSYLSLATL